MDRTHARPGRTACSPRPLCLGLLQQAATCGTCNGWRTIVKDGQLKKCPTCG